MKNKPKIAFVTYRMMMGGIEKALISMLEQIPKEKFDVTLLVVNSGGELFDKIPSYVKVKNVFDRKRRIAETVCNFIISGRIIRAFSVILNAFLLKYGEKSEFKESLRCSNTMPIEDSEFDVAISYCSPLSLPVVYVVKNLVAKKKMLWIHSDLGDLVTEGSPVLVKKLRKYYKLYDNILCVSHHALKEFNKAFPNLPTKITVFYNIMDKSKIVQLSKESGSFNDSFKGIRILTTGRLSVEKGQEIIPKILSRLLEDGYNVRWYCIGNGPILEQLESKIKDYHLEKNLILLGIKQNPYPYFKDCDLYVQPSLEEAYCITVAEARALHKPIIATNTGASEQIIHEKTGLVVEFDEIQIYKSIKRLLDDHSLKERLIQNLGLETIDTTTEMEKFYKLVEKTR